MLQQTKSNKLPKLFLYTIIFLFGTTLYGQSPVYFTATDAATDFTIAELNTRVAAAPGGWTGEVIFNNIAVNIPANAFRNYVGGLTKITFIGNIGTIGSQAFYFIDALLSVEFYDDVNVIDLEAFRG